MHTTWVKEPQCLPNGQVTDVAMIIHSYFPGLSPTTITLTLREDALEEVGWDSETDRVRPVYVNSEQWDLELPIAEIEELSALVSPIMAEDDGGTWSQTYLRRTTRLSSKSSFFRRWHNHFDKLCKIIWY